jgi:hypothetical protein
MAGCYPPSASPMKPVTGFPEGFPPDPSTFPYLNTLLWPCPDEVNVV